jgi:collagenase-like PrtC family protease
MKNFSVPADFKKETIDGYDRLNSAYKDSRVIETYGNITKGKFFESGRSVELLPGVDLTALQEYVEYSKQRNIGFNYTLNASHMQNKEFTRKGMLEIVNFLGKLYKAGIRSLIISLPSLLELVRSSGYDFEIKTSVICQVVNPNKALIYKKLGVRRIVIDESLNRDFSTLKRIRNAIGAEKIELIVNSICHKDCTHRMFHYNQISGDSVGVPGEASLNYYTHRCLLRRLENRGNLLKLTWIRPEDMGYYTGIGIEYFKLQGRHLVFDGDPVRAVGHYFKGSYEGDLFELLDLFNPTSEFRVFIDNRCLEGFIKPFYEKENFCKNDCPRCNYCESFASRCIGAKEAAEVRESAAQFYGEFDGFNKLTGSLTGKKTNPVGKDNMDIDFNLD